MKRLLGHIIYFAIMVGIGLLNDWYYETSELWEPSIEFIKISVLVMILSELKYGKASKK